MTVRVRAVILIAVAAAGLGVCLGAVFAPGSAPATLKRPAAQGVVEVERSGAADARQLAVEFEVAQARTLAAQVSGTVVRSDCTPGDVIESGDYPAQVDGTDLVALHLPAPPWRDFAAGTTGPDVAGLQEALAALGHDVSASGTLDAPTMAALAALKAGSPAATAADSAAPETDSAATEAGGAVSEAGSAGTGAESAASAAEPAVGLGLAQLLWLPEPSLTVSACPVALGARYEAGTPLVETGGNLAAIKVEPPADAVAGARILSTGDIEGAVDASGRSTAPDLLAAIESSRWFTAASATTSGEAAEALPIEWRLAEPIPVVALPPGALYAIDGDTACVLAADGSAITPLAVRIMASQLGTTYAAADPLPTRVESRPGPDAPPCT
ncbi:MAG: hypothetical protein LBJ08_01730 [Bifidobacteriaceae bacterium]|jgi:hypothetical protein|nr:hypothetical protein [Bifidobacteriaceae bacterium]